MKSSFKIDVFVKNGHDRNHMLAIINEKSYKKNEANDDNNVKNMSNYLRYQSLDQK